MFYIKFIVLTFMYLAWSFAFIGYGTMLFRGLGIGLKMPREHFVLLGYLVGLFFTSALVSFINLYLPLAGGVAVSILGLGVLLFLVNFSSFKELFTVRNLLVVYVIVVLLGLKSLAGPAWSNFDSGLYHTQQIKWMAESALVFGLGNLHMRFATDSFFFNLAAAFELPGLKGRGFEFINFYYGLIYTVLLVYGFIELMRNRNLKVSNAFLIAAFPAFWWFMEEFVMNPTPDGSTLVMMVIVSYVLILFLENRKSQLCVDYFAILAMATAGIFTIKLSTPPLVLAPAVTFFLIDKENHQNRKKTWGGAMAVCLSFILLYCTRNFLLSGCPLFHPALCFPGSTEWAMPREEVMRYYLSIRNWGGYAKTEDGYPDWPKFLPFLWGFIGVIKGSLISVALTFIVTKIDRKYFHRLQFDRLLLVVPVVVLLLCIFYWMMMAPILRHGMGYHYALQAFGIAVLMVFILNFIPHIKLQRLYPGAIGTVLLGGAYIYFLTIGNPVTLDAPFFESKYESMIQHDVRYFLPINNYGQCWFAPLPCSPDLLPNLHARHHEKGNFKMFYFPGGQRT